MELDFLQGKKVAELREIGRALKIPGADKMKKAELKDLLTSMYEESLKNGEQQSEAGAAQQPEETPAAEVKTDAAAEVIAEKAPGSAEESENERKTDAAAEIVTEKTAPETAIREAEEKKTEKPSKRKTSPKKAQDRSAKSKDALQAKDGPSEKMVVTVEKTGEETGEDAEKKKNSAPKKNRKPAKEQKPADPQENTPEAPEAPAADAKSRQPEAEPEKQADQAQAEKPQQEKKKQLVVKDGRFETKGILEIVEQGYGFLRFDNYLTSDQDIFVNQIQIKRFNLKTGDMIECIARPPQEGDRFGALLYVKTVNGDEPGKAIHRADFADLTPIYPTERIVLENGSSALSMRMTDIIAPIGKGQRGLIVAPPKAGKTTLLKQIAQSIEKQGTECELIVLLIDERPEEVTDMKRSINGEVIYSTFDEQPSNHVKVAEMVLARAMRLAEHGKDVIILLDSITRLARAYNLVEPPSGRTLSGGLDPAALYKPKKFFGAARNTEEGGSITILATALIETGSRMDDMIFEEFKGTGNMELHLDRKLSEKRIFPAINLNKSGTRREDMLMSADELEAVWMMRRAVADMGIQDATEKIVFDMVHTRKNADFVERMRKMRL